MFDDLLESTVVKKKTNKGWSVVLSGIVQALILSILILIPLIYTEALPKAMLSTLLNRPASSSASSSPAAAGQDDRQAGGALDPVRKADAAARDSEGSGCVQGSRASSGRDQQHEHGRRVRRHSGQGT